VDVVVTLEHRFDRTPDGAVWTQAQLLYDFWEPYLNAFDRVRPVARVRDVKEVPGDWKRADGPCVSFAAVPYYLGPWQYLRRRSPVWQAAQAAVGPRDAVVLRGGAPIADAVERLLHRTGRPFGLEVLGDPYEALAPGAVRHPLRPFFRWWFTRELRRHCRHTCAAAYVTRHTLQERYPCSGLAVCCSDVQIPPEAFVPEPRPPSALLRGTDCQSVRLNGRIDNPSQTRPFTLVFVGSLEQLYKAPHVLIDAVAQEVRGGLDLELVMVGDGKHRPELEARAADRVIGSRVRFLGQLTAGAAVRAQLDRADLFVLPSFTEGLPRAMIEAMARALPCLGSTAGGIPELLPPEDMVPPGDAAALAAEIRAVATDPDRLARMSARNLARAREYDEKALRRQRIAFYQYVREQTEAWLERRNGTVGAYHHGS
jgi:glycosyltransferase involved in cell wall biosynthesis